MKKPYLLIVCGPTASGKGSLPRKVLNYLSHNNLCDTINCNDPPVKCLVDDLIETNPTFKEEIIKYFSRKFGYDKKIIYAPDDKLTINIQNAFLNPDQQMIVDLSKIYYDARIKGSCESLTNDLKSQNCDIINDTKLNLALINKQNIVFESTCESWPAWLFAMHKDKLWDPNGNLNYHIVIAWTGTDICELFKRNKSRAKTSVTDFVGQVKDDGKDSPPPRLPDINPESYKLKLNKIIQTYIKIIRTISNSKKYVGVSYQHNLMTKIQLLVYNNTTRRKPLYKNFVYDSYIHDDILGERILYQIYDPKKDCSSDVLYGGKRKSKKKSKRRKKRKKTYKK